MLNITNLESFIKNCKDINILKYFIDNVIDLNVGSNYKLIHLICWYQPFEAIKYIIDKGVDFECEDINK